MTPLGGPQGLGSGAGLGHLRASVVGWKGLPPVGCRLLCPVGCRILPDLGVPPGHGCNLGGSSQSATGCLNLVEYSAHLRMQTNCWVYFYALPRRMWGGICVQGSCAFSSQCRQGQASVLGTLIGCCSWSGSMALACLATLEQRRPCGVPPCRGKALSAEAVEAHEGVHANVVRALPHAWAHQGIAGVGV